MTKVEIEAAGRPETREDLLRAALARITETYPPDTVAGKIAADTLAAIR